MFEKILVGTDGSENSERALKAADEVRRKWNAKMVVFHSITHKLPEPTISLSTSYPTGMDYSFTEPFSYNPKESELVYTINREDYENIESIHESQGRKIIDRAKQALNFEEEQVEYRLVYDKHPEHYIIKQCEEENFDLVVLGCKGKHSKLERTFIGTVSTKVLNEATCDVLIVR